MATIKLTSQKNFPLTWANLEYYPDSKGLRKVVYTHVEGTEVEELTMLYHTLFGPFKDSINVYAYSWWDLCMDAWNTEDNAGFECIQIEPPTNRSYFFLNGIPPGSIFPRLYTGS